MNKSLYLLLAFGLIICSACKNDNQQRGAIDLPALVKKYNTAHPGIEIKNLNFEGLKADSRKNFDFGMRTYNRGEWQKSFDLLFRINPKTDIIMLYEANCQLQLNAYTKAKEILTTLIQVTRAETLQHAQWYMLLSEMGLANKTGIQKWLTTILKTPGHAHHSEALEIQEALLN